MQLMTQQAKPALEFGALETGLGGDTGSRGAEGAAAARAGPPAADRSSFTTKALCVLVLALLVVVIERSTALKSLADDVRALQASSSVVISKSAVPPSGFALGEALHKGKGEWVDKTPLALPTSDLQTVACGGAIYVLGGLTGTQSAGTAVATMMRFDQYYETHTARAPMPTPRFRFGAACLDGVVYVAGGFVTKALGDAGKPDGALYAYNATGNTWAAKASMPTARGDIALVASTVTGKLYAFGGYEKDYAVTSAAVDAYDPTTNTWIAKVGTMPGGGRADFAAVELGTKLYAIGGWDSAYPPNPSKKVEVFDPASRTFAAGAAAAADLSVARGDSAVVVMRGSIYVIGGETFNPAVKCAGGNTNGCWLCGYCIPLHDVEMYDATNNVWITVAPVPAPRFRFQGAYANGAIFTFGGHSQGQAAVKTVESYYAVDTAPLYLHYKQA